MLFKHRCDFMVAEARVKLDKIRVAVDALRNSTSLRAVLEVSGMPDGDWRAQYERYHVPLLGHAHCAPSLRFACSTSSPSATT